ncbi:MAG: pilus assembly protein [Beijerinckiaceae bacterium]|nr:pilus assembly protein [Beijerinckiaceae bacterium]
MLASVGGAVDYFLLTKVQLNLQTVADAAALAGASDFRLADSTAARVTSITEGLAKSQLRQLSQNADIKVTVDQKSMVVHVDLQTTQHTFMLPIIGGRSEVELSAAATAVVKGSASICVIGLDSKENQTVYLEKDAKLEAPNCAIYSNSTKNNGLKAMKNSQVHALFICSAGGKYSDKSDAFTPSPQVDCPIMADPLAAREPPPVGDCTATNLKISSYAKLDPGTYCGGISIEKTAMVEMNPGVYVIKDGLLNVTGQASLKGANVGFYLTGKGATINFDANTSISLTAPKTGIMAGMLFFEDRANKFGQKHDILSNDAKMLLGTIYLSGGELSVASSQPVAQDSAYTIVVARKFSLSAGPTMVMNTNYNDTDIPVPAGVGPGRSSPFLTQ